MKRIVSYLLCLLLVFGLVGCSRHTNKSFSTSSNDDSSLIEDEDDDESDVSNDIAKDPSTSDTDEPVTQNTEEQPSDNNDNGQSVNKKDNGSSSQAADDTTSSKKTKKTDDTKTDTKKKETKTEKTSTKKTSGKKVIVIDPGHQAKANTALEAIGPGASEKKAKVTGGATGKKTGIRESEIVLKVAKKLQKLLEAEGYEVIMTRTSQNVNLSNKERADIANKANADVFVRIHCDGASSSSAQGASVLAPKDNNPYLTAKNIKASQKLCSKIISAFVKTTGARNRGVSKVNNMSGINWCKVPVCLIEMGFLSNAKEEALLVSDDYQDKCAKGIAKGINDYLNN